MALAKLDDAPLLGQILDGKYALVDLLGGGGYGSVYRSLQQPLGREVAVKVLHGAALNLKVGRDRFEREALALARLTSVHTVRLIDFGVTREGPVGVRNLPFMVMELIEGEDLEHRIRRGPVPPAEVLDLLEGIADSLNEAHQAGVIHRDLKPSNILITRTHTGRVIPKVIDFGIARIEGGNKSQTGFLTGTPAYMAPEQARGLSDLDLRVDVYALAAMTFELLSGRPPYTGGDPVAILTAHCLAPIPSLRTVAKDRDTWVFDGPLGSGLAKDRDERHATVAAFVVACRGAWAGRGAPAAPAVTDSTAAALLPGPSAQTPSLVSTPSSSVSSSSSMASSPARAAATSADSAGGVDKTDAYDSPPGAEAAMAAYTTQVSSSAATHISQEAAMATPLTISNLPNQTPTFSPEETSPALTSRPRGMLIGVGIGAGAAAVAGIVLISGGGESTHAPAQEPVVVTPYRAPAPQSAPPVAVSVAVSRPLEPTAGLQMAPPTAAVAARQPTSRPRPKELETPLRRDTKPAEDAPPVVGSELADRLAADVDRALDECRCGAAMRLSDQLAAAPQGGVLAAARRARIAACRPVDIDHRCVQGRLVEVE